MRVFDLLCLALIFAVCSPRGDAATRAEPHRTGDNPALIRAVFAALERGDVQALNRAFDPQGVSLVGLESRPRGGPFASFAEAAPFPAALEPRSVKVESLIATGDQVAVRSLICGQHKQPMLDFAPTGREVCARYHNLYRIRDGRIVENAVGVDRSQIRAQLEQNAKASAQSDAPAPVDAANDRDGSTRDVEILRQIKLELWPRAYREQDPALLDRILDERFQMVDGAGQVSTKAAELAWVSENKPGYEAFKFEIERLEVDANSALIVGIGTLQFPANSGQPLQRYRSSNVFVRRAGNWRAIASHVSMLPAETGVPPQPN